MASVKKKALYSYILIVIYDQFKLVSDPSSNIREVTK
jgi:hypothetical protein